MKIQGTKIRGLKLYSSAATVDADSYFNLVSLLLPGNGTNGAQNNTFLDSSTNNLSITRNGNPTQGTFSPFSQTGWSGYFDGTGDYLSSTLTASAPGTGSFTYECWFYINSLGSAVGIFNTRSGDSTDGFDVNVSTSNQLQITYTGSVLGSVSGIIANQWNHLAIVRNGSTNWTVYINGNVGTTISNSTNFTSTTMLVGAVALGASSFNGYISNFRYGTSAVYTSSFTPPTSPLTDITGTKFLICQSNRFVDNSSNAFAITVNGNTAVQPFSPFNPNAAYSTTSVGGSAYFDGSGDYLTVPDSASFDLPGDFTVEFFAYATGSNVRRWFQLGDYRAGQNGLLIYSASFSSIVVYVNDSVIITGPTLVPYQWVHVACVRQGAGSDNLKLYVNGSLAGQVTNTTSFTGVAGNGISLGAEYGGSFAATFETYMSNVRLVKGTAVYTSAFTPPTAPLTAIANTQLLVNYTNGGITDAAAKNDLETVGDAQISTAQSKWGGSSMYFDGTGDYLSMVETAILNFGSGDFTIEAWIYATATVGANRPIWSTGTNNTNWMSLFLHTTAGRPEFFIGSGGSTIVDIWPADVISTNTWYHLAVTRSGSTFRMFLNGTVIGSGTSATAVPDYTDNYRVGYGRWNGDAGVYAGYINDLRITKGLARYTANFTPPTAAFPTQ